MSCRERVVMGAGRSSQKSAALNCVRAHNFFLRFIYIYLHGFLLADYALNLPRTPFFAELLIIKCSANHYSTRNYSAAATATTTTPTTTTNTTHHPYYYYYYYHHCYYQYYYYYYNPYYYQHHAYYYYSTTIPTTTTTIITTTTTPTTNNATTTTTITTTKLPKTNFQNHRTKFKYNSLISMR